MRRALICVVAAAALASGAAWANDKSLPPGLTGDWGGLRTDLSNDGVQLQSRAVFEGAANPSGGDRQAAAGAGEGDFLALADLGKLIGDDGGSLEARITDRFGANLATAAGLHTLMQPQEIWGRSDIWRLSQLSFSQDLFANKVNIEIGRMNPGSGADVLACNFENLTFCGSQPGNIDGDYWYNSPVSQWGAQVKANLSKTVYVQTAAYQINPKKFLRDGFTFDFSGGKGALISFELGWTPKFLAGLPGLYQIGGWYSSMRAPDMFDDLRGNAQAVTGLAARQDAGRSGFYLSAKQQLTGDAPADGALPTVNGHGLTVFANFVQSDRQTSNLDRQFSLGAIYKGAIPGRDDDEIALALGTTHVNDRVALGESLQNVAGMPFESVQNSEYVAEADYRFIITPNAEVTPNLQYIGAPGGVADRAAVLVVGLKTMLTL